MHEWLLFYGSWLMTRDHTSLWVAHGQVTAWGVWGGCCHTSAWKGWCLLGLGGWWFSIGVDHWQLAIDQSIHSSTYLLWIWNNGYGLVRRAIERQFLIVHMCLKTHCCFHGFVFLALETLTAPERSKISHGAIRAHHGPDLFWRSETWTCHCVLLF